MILVDSNIPMYLVGAAHPHKTDAQLLVERSVAAGERLVTDAEVLQEVLHRYVSIKRRDAIQAAFDVLLGIVDDVLSVELADVERAKIIVHGHPDLSARDAIHLAIMERIGADQIMSFDHGFDTFPGVTRLSG